MKYVALYEICKEFVNKCEEHLDIIDLVAELDTADDIKDIDKICDKLEKENIDMLDFIYAVLKIKQKGDAVYEFVLEDIEKYVQKIEEEGDDLSM